MYYIESLLIWFSFMYVLTYGDKVTSENIWQYFVVSLLATILWVLSLIASNLRDIFEEIKNKFKKENKK